MRKQHELNGNTMQLCRRRAPWKSNAQDKRPWQCTTTTKNDENTCDKRTPQQIKTWDLIVVCGEQWYWMQLLHSYTNCYIQSLNPNGWGVYFWPLKP